MAQATVQTDSSIRLSALARPSIAVPTLTVLKGPQVGRQLSLPPRLEAYVVGRDRRADVQIEHETISRAHVELRIGPPPTAGALATVLLVDRGSTNGTWVNGARVEEAMLAPGARVQMGDVILRLDLHDRTDPSFADPVVDAVDLSTFEEALEGIELVYQPIVRWDGRRTVGWEALLRSSAPSLPTPLAMLDAARRLGRLWQLGRKARRLAAAAAAHAPRETHIFVNVHPDDLDDEVLYDPGSALSQVADRVVLEITERSSLDVVHRFDDRLVALRALGFRIAVDDLGAGYAGLSSLARIRPDLVKIDMELVRGIDGDPTRQRLVRSVRELCRELGSEVVAEGVETVAERDVVLRLGCELLQGFLLARPAPELVPVPG